jgi:hypothetical protein
MRHLLLLPALVLGGSALAVKPHDVQVTAVDYAMQAPDTVRAGTLRFTFANRGRVAHEVVIGLLRPTAGNREMITASQEGLRLHDAPEHYLDGAPIGALYAWPGGSSPASLTLPAQAGQRYALFCRFSDSVGAPPHASMGMVRTLIIR